MVVFYYIAFSNCGQFNIELLESSELVEGTQVLVTLIPDDESEFGLVTLKMQWIGWLIFSPRPFWKVSTMKLWIDGSDRFVVD